MQLFIKSLGGTFTLNVDAGATVSLCVCVYVCVCVCVCIYIRLWGLVHRQVDSHQSTSPRLLPLPPRSLIHPTHTHTHTQTVQVEQLKAAVENKEFIPSALQRLVTGTQTLTTGRFVCVCVCMCVCMRVFNQ